MLKLLRKNYTVLCFDIMCRLRSEDWAALYGQSSHLKGLSPVWDRRCIVNLPLCVKAALQIEHLKGLSPVCVRICWRTWLDCMKDLPQTGHLNKDSGFEFWYVCNILR